MQQFIKALDDLPWIAKIILCLPALDIIWNIYRLCRSIDKQNTLGIVLAVVMTVVGFAFVWIIDLICIIMNQKIWWID